MFKQFIFLMLLLTTGFVMAKDKVKNKNLSPLSLSSVLRSTMASYPLIEEALQKIEASRMEIKESMGAFDLKLEAKRDMRTAGYYDGTFTSVIIKKHLPYFNTRLYTGYKVSQGEFPVYEGKYETLREGEFKAGFELSLWRNRDIDPFRLELFNNKLNLSAKSQELIKVKIKVRKSAAKAYWVWVAKGQELTVNEELLAIAIKRNLGIKKRIRRGDLAKIYEVENNQYIAKRKTQVAKSVRSFKEASLNLSLYLRDSEGTPLVPEKSNLPFERQVKARVSRGKLEKDLAAVTLLSPDLLKMNIELAKYANDEKFGLNKLRPKIDFSFEVSKDSGKGLKSLKETENRAILKLEIPLERRLGQGKVNKARANMRAISSQKKILIEKIKVRVKSLFFRINTAVSVIENTDKEVGYSQILQKAELKKFFNGASDFFVVNIREQNLANAKIKNIKAHLDYQKAFADYLDATFSFDQN